MKRNPKCPKCKAKLQRGGTMYGVGPTARCPKCRTLYKAAAFQK